MFLVLRDTTLICTLALLLAFFFERVIQRNATSPANILPRRCLTSFPNTLRFVKNAPLLVVFATLFSVFDILLSKLDFEIQILDNVINQEQFPENCRSTVGRQSAERQSADSRPTVSFRDFFSHLQY